MGVDHTDQTRLGRRQYAGQAGRRRIDRRQKLRQHLLFGRQIGQRFRAFGIEYGIAQNRAGDFDDLFGFDPIQQGFDAFADILAHKCDRIGPVKALSTLSRPNCSNAMRSSLFFTTI